MVAKLKHIIKDYLKPSALVLMYHRVEAPDHDVWDISVHPERFEQQLQALKNHYRVIPLSELLDRQKKNSLQSNTLAITFDDGYADNFFIAKPLLDKYNLPATFFIATRNTDTANGFWWDELEEVMLGTAQLPTHFKMNVSGIELDLDLGEECNLTQDLKEKLSHWKAFVQETDTQRSKLFLQLWQVLRPLAHAEQQQYLASIKEWAGRTAVDEKKSTCMSYAQLKELAANSLFEVGSHTNTHPLLPSLSKEQQLLEWRQNRDVLQDITSQNVKTCSFPYGAYNAESIEVTQQIGFSGAFTTQEQRIHQHTNPFQLGRIQVPDLGEQAFQKFLSYPR
ncbi:polysaccharide deacetylase family protein [Rufibacter sp. DG15C]|uniref:polysaccharide deacetylase family protein n=1 Tax=Rufibacter sp. DG15C TaxID=1379909 RepID=UPI000835FBE2|nr:polysaccharide deacetylase family protein [Rufibacter sp. DG15C]